MFFIGTHGCNTSNSKKYQPKRRLNKLYNPNQYNRGLILTDIFAMILIGINICNSNKFDLVLMILIVVRRVVICGTLSMQVHTWISTHDINFNPYMLVYGNQRNPPSKQSSCTLQSFRTLVHPHDLAYTYAASISKTVTHITLGWKKNIFHPSQNI